MSNTENRHAEQYRQLGLNIAFYRKLQNLTQLELAEKVGISRTHMSNIEAPNMITAISFDLILDIADTLNIDICKLLEMRK